MDGENEVRVVVGVDFSDAGTRAMEEALGYAYGHPCVAIHLLSVIDPTSGGEGPARGATLPQAALATREWLWTHARATFDEQARLHGAPPFDRAAIHVRSGSPAEEILRLAFDVDADLVVVGTHARRGLDRLRLGSVATRVFRRAKCPVLVARPKTWETARPEPTCPDCLAKRAATEGAALWCDVHARPHEPPHALSYSRTFRTSSPLWFGADRGG